MKRNSTPRAPQILLLLGLGILALAMALLPGAAELLPKPTPPEISVIFRDSDSALWANLRLGMEQAAYDTGADLRFLTPTRPGGAQEQAELLRREAQRGAGAIVLIPTDVASLDKTLGGMDLHVPVVSLELPLEVARLQLLTDDAAMGRALALALAEDAPGGTALLLSTAPDGASLRLTAARYALEEAGIRVVVADAALSELPSRLEALLEQSGARAVMTFDPAATQIAAAELEKQADDSPPIYGVGSTEQIIAALERGTVAACAAWNSYAAGYLAVSGAVQLAEGRAVQDHILEFTVVRGDEIYELENQRLLFPVP